MILSSVLSFARIQAQTDGNGLTDANGVVFATEANQDFHRQLVDSGVDASGIAEKSINMQAGVGVYSYPTNPSMLFLKAIEADYSGTGGANYKTASQIDVSNLAGSGSFSYYRVNAKTEQPLFDDRGNVFEIFPTPTGNVASGINVMYFTQPSVYSATTDAVNYPEGIDAAILGWRVAANFKYSIGDMPSGDYFNNKYQERVRQYISTLGRGTQQPTQATTIQLSGFEF